jgi:hypothetical protein
VISSRGLKSYYQERVKYYLKIVCLVSPFL